LRKLTSDDALRAATGLLLLSPQIPLLFMDEEYGSTQPFLFFTDYTGDLADAVREGRRREFARFSSFSDEKRRAQIPDPNDVKTFAASSPPASHEAAKHDSDEAKDRLDWMHFYKSALAVRAKLITPRLQHSKSCGVTVLTAANGGDANALIARWKLCDGETLSVALNLSKESVACTEIPAGKVIFETPPRVRRTGRGQGFAALRVRRLADRRRLRLRQRPRCSHRRTTGAPRVTTRRPHDTIVTLASRAGFEVEWQDAHHTTQRVPESTLAVLLARMVCRAATPRKSAQRRRIGSRIVGPRNYRR
jgi:1,4-alpha-glucan branching enzyme